MPVKGSIRLLSVFLLNHDPSNMTNFTKEFIKNLHKHSGHVLCEGVILFYASQLRKEIEKMKIPVTVLATEKIGAYDVLVFKTDPIKIAINMKIDKVLNLLPPNQGEEKNNN